MLIGPAMTGAIWQMTFALEQPIPLERLLAAHLELIERALSR